MRIASYEGRAIIITNEGAVDIGLASRGGLPSTTDDLIPRLEELRSWYKSEAPAPNIDLSVQDFETDLSKLDPVLTRPRQIFAIGLNYKSHSDEMDMAIPKAPMVFTKFASSLSGPGADIVLPPGTNDWEVELVAIVGKGGRDISASDALNHICGYCIGQDISERTTQMLDNPAQFSLAKSFKGFSPIGPWITTADEIEDPESLDIMCSLDEETLQSSNTSMMIFDIRTQVEYLSSVCELYPGDIIFTGTPAGVGFSRSPQKWLEKGKVLHSRIEGLGRLHNPCI